MENTEILNLAREIGMAIQRSDEYINYRMNEQKVECSKKLQNTIKKFNLKKSEINAELSKESSSQEKMDKLNSEISELYKKITNDEDMTKFNETKRIFDEMLGKISYLISECAKGEDPYKIEIPDEENCTGSCSTCSGCH